MERVRPVEESGSQEKNRHEQQRHADGAAPTVRFVGERSLQPGFQYSIPRCAITPFSYACFTCFISVTVSAISTMLGWALRPVRITWTIGGFCLSVSTTFAGSSMP